MSVEIVPSVNREEWDRFVHSHPCATLYHDWTWMDLIIRTYGYRPLYAVDVSPSGGICAALPAAFVGSRLTGNRIISYPFSDSCCPLVDDDSQSQPLLKALEEERIRSRSKFKQVRLVHPHGIDVGDPTEYCGHVLSLLRTPQELFEGLHKSCIQRAIRKAEKQGIEVVQGDNEQHVREFYQLHLETRSRHGVPVQPYRFFRNLWLTFSNSGRLELLLARQGEKFLAGIVTLFFRERAHYKFGASDASENHTGTNQLLMWQAIQRAQAAGMKVFDFGRTSLSNPGLDTYKSRWGTTRKPMWYVEMPLSRKLGCLNESSAPHRFLKNISRHMPKWLNRVNGELFYRHLA